MSTSAERARNLLFAQFGIIAILAGLHLLAVNYFLYWRFPWFDLLTHFIGGVWIAVFIAWISMLRNKIPYLVGSLLAVFAFGVLWELFEVQNLIIDVETGALDSVKDIAIALLGGAIGAYFARFLSV